MTDAVPAETTELPPSSRWRIPRLVRSSAVYGVSAALARGFSLLLLPVLTHYLPPADYGYVVTLQVYLAFGASIFGSTTQAALPRALFQGGTASAGHVLPTLLSLVFSAAVFSSVVLAIIGQTPLILWMHLALPPLWLIAVPMMAAFDVVWTYYLATLRFQERPRAYAIAEIGRGLSSFVLILMALALVRAGWQGVAFANLAVIAITSLLAFTQLRRARLFSGAPTSALFRSAASEAAGLLPHAVGSFVIALADRLLLGLMFGRAVVAIYAIGYSVGAVVTLATESVNRALAPRIYRDLASPTPETRRALVRITYLYAAGALAVAAVIAVVMQWLLPILTAPDYHRAARYVPWIAFAFAVNGVYSVLFPYLVHTRQTAFLGRATLIAALFNVVLTWWLIGWIGPVGAAVATLLAYCVRLALVWRRVAFLTQMPWAFWRRAEIGSPA